MKNPNQLLDDLVKALDNAFISASQYMRRRYHYRLRQHAQCQDRSEALQSYRAMLAFTGSTRGNA